MEQGAGKKSISRTTILILLCWCVYMCSYIGRLGYNANITQIEKAYLIEDHSKAGLVSTFYFFAYGIGQVVNGILCKRYNIRLVVFFSLLISGVMNIVVGITTNFSIIKYLWLINGAVLSVLWSSLIYLLSQTVEKKDISRAVIAMGTSAASGTFFVYGLSALFVAYFSYVVMFFLAGILLPCVAFIWVFAYPQLVRTQEKSEEQGREIVSQQQQKGFGKLWIPICVLALFAVIDNLVKDGLTTWVPTILKESYNLPDSISILLTIFLPAVAIFSSATVLLLHKKAKDFVVLASLLFLIAFLSIGVVILSMPKGWVVLTLCCFMLVAFLMSGINNIVTSIAPLYWKGKVNSGLLAGVLNGFCYLGSTISAYGLGAIADIGGWYMVFALLAFLCLIAVIVALCYKLGDKIIFRKKNVGVKSK